MESQRGVFPIYMFITVITLKYVVWLSHSAEGNPSRQVSMQECLFFPVPAPAILLVLVWKSFAMGVRIEIGHGADGVRAYYLSARHFCF